MSATKTKNPQLTEDQELLKLLRDQKSQNEGFRKLLECYQERLYWHIRRLVVDHEDANDVVQNTFVKVYRGIGGFKGDAKLYTWLYRIASNEALTFLKRKKKMMTEALERPDYDLSQQLHADPYFDGSDVQRRLQSAIASLPDKQKQVFVMRYYDEMTYKEISNVLKTSVGGLKASFHHAVRKIEDYVKDE